MLNTLSGGVAADQWVADYHQYLEGVVGAAATTCVRHLPIVRRFIARSFGPAAPDWTMLSVGQLGEFIRREAAVRTGHGRKAPACAIRSFLRFLAWRGAVPGGFDRAIPTIRQARHASLPRRLSTDQIERLLASATSYPAARRDRAVLLLLAGLGLRAGEVVTLGLDDIGWGTGSLRLRPGKSRRERLLPLSHELGEGLADYVRYDRPVHPSRRVFLTVRKPPTPFAGPAAVTKIVQRGYGGSWVTTV